MERNRLKKGPGRESQWVIIVAAFVAISIVGCSSEPPMNLLVVTLDTTRADHLACYGHPRAMTPNIDRLASSGARFDAAYAAAPITLPSHSTIFTGTYPMFHGVRDNGVFVLAERNLTLAEMLKGHGYATAAAVGSFPVTAKFGLDQGFDLFDDRVAQREQDFFGERVAPKTRFFFDERPAGLVNEAILPWIRAHSETPFFVWAHYFDPHQPFEPPPPYDQLFASDLYLGEIAYADECLGVILAELDDLGIADRTIVVVVADHGEGLGDHGEETHSVLTYNPTVRVPLIIAVPGAGATVVTSKVGTVDIVPSVLELLGLGVPEQVQGTSRVPEILGEGSSPDRALYAETLSPRIAHGWGELRTIYDGDLKLIFGPRPELYDVTADPDELEDLVGIRADDAENLEAKLRLFVEEHAADDLEAAVEMDEETRRQLSALGYLHTAADGGIDVEEQLRQDGSPPQDRVGDINALSHVKQLLFQRNAVMARGILEGLLEEQPGNPAYLEMLATAEVQLGRLDEALAVFRGMEQFVQGGEVARRLMLQIGSAYLFRGDAGIAMEMADRANTVEPSAQAFYLRSMALATMSRTDEEITALDAAVDFDPAFTPARINRAIRRAGRGDRAAAEADFREALRSNPYSARGSYNFGAFLVEDNDLEGAAQRFERAVQLDPRYLEAHFALAAVSADLGRWDQVREVSERLDVLAPKSTEAVTVRGYLEEGS